MRRSKFSFSPLIILDVLIEGNERQQQKLRLRPERGPQGAEGEPNPRTIYDEIQGPKEKLENLPSDMPSNNTFGESTTKDVKKDTASEFKGETENPLQDSKREKSGADNDSSTDVFLWCPDIGYSEQDIDASLSTATSLYENYINRYYNMTSLAPIPVVDAAVPIVWTLVNDWKSPLRSHHWATRDRQDCKSAKMRLKLRKG